MTRSRISVKLDNGSSFTVRIDWPATYASREASYRTLWRYVCRNADGTIATRGSDLGDALVGSNAQRDAQRAACALLSFAEHYAETSEDISPDDRALGEWWSANDDVLQNWQSLNDRERYGNED
jgi:hypothetical protein